RTLLQRPHETGAQLAFVERLAPAIALDHVRQLDLRRLERVEALPALLAPAPPPDRRAVVGNARIDHARVVMLAEGAVHRERGNGEWGMGNGESSGRTERVARSRGKCLNHSRFPIPHSRPVSHTPETSRTAR